VGVLYPPGLPKAGRLRAYSEIFRHVEVNSTYYATPPAKTVERWARETSEGFRFDIKLHRILSQSPAKAAEGGSKGLVSSTLRQLKPLMKTGKLGVFLLMLSPYFTPGRHALKELDAVVEAFGPHGLAVEFRHRAWLATEAKAEALDYFRANRIAWVMVDMPRLDQPGVMPPTFEVTSGLAYLRLHGRNKRGYADGKTAAEKHDYLYKDSELKELAARIRKLARRAEQVRVVANNHAHDYAPRTALALKKLLKA
jgi:uncharacterized protein YecE (DUF72 family)